MMRFALLGLALGLLIGATSASITSKLGDQFEIIERAFEKANVKGMAEALEVSHNTLAANEDLSKQAKLQAATDLFWMVIHASKHCDDEAGSFLESLAKVARERKLPIFGGLVHDYIEERQHNCAQH